MWGLCHIVTDEDNYDNGSLLWVLEECEKEENKNREELEITKLICKELLKLSMNERNLLFNSFYYDFDCFSNNKCKDCLIENPNKCVRKEV